MIFGPAAPHLSSSLPSDERPKPVDLQQRNQTIAHDVRNSPVRLGACFLSVTERFDAVGSDSNASLGIPAGLGPGAGDSSRGAGFVGPVERYDFVNARQQPPTCEDRWHTPVAHKFLLRDVRKAFTFRLGRKKTVTHIVTPLRLEPLILENQYVSWCLMTPLLGDCHVTWP